MFTEVQSRIGTLWCNLAHDSFMWPVHGEFQCRACGRRYPAFAEAPIASAAGETVGAHAAVASLSRA